MEFVRIISLFISSLPCALSSPASLTGLDVRDSASTQWANCNTGQYYCYEQIVQDLGYPSDLLLKQYCDQTWGSTNTDYATCWPCKQFSMPCAPERWAHRTVFECVDGNATYRWDHWCFGHGCAAGVCWAKDVLEGKGMFDDEDEGDGEKGDGDG